ncbi:MAG: hypothetical protein Q8K20_06290 [Gemmobacter sp.]|jgi:hypothetical protein|nr:hypothetical protein [Gemmobacter sp.]
MKAKILFSALALGLLPGLAMAQCMDKHEQVVQCGQGESRDPVSGQCTKPVHS